MASELLKNVTADEPSVLEENEAVAAVDRQDAALQQDVKGLLGKSKQARVLKGLDPPQKLKDVDMPDERGSLFPQYSSPENDLVNNDNLAKRQSPLIRKWIEQEKLEPGGRFPITPEINGTMAPGPKASWDESVVDFLFGGEMAILGMQYDNGVLTHDWETAKQQWSEEPLWMNALNTISLGSYAFPLARGAYLSAKYGKLGGILGQTASKGEELNRFKALGLVDDTMTKLDDKTAQTLRNIEKSRTDYADYQSKIDMAANGDESVKLSMSERATMGFKNQFGNSYMDIVGTAAKGDETARTAFNKNLNELFAREDLGRFYHNMPDYGLDDTRFAEHFFAKMGVSTARSTLKGKDLQWADGLEAAMKSHTAEGLDNGFLTPETVARIGEMHIPAQFKDTPIPDISTGRKLFLPETRKATAKEIEGGLASQGDTITAMSAFDIPRLDSPTLKFRKKELPEVYPRLSLRWQRTRRGLPEQTILQLCPVVLLELERRVGLA
jgi:hypothetical protein